MVEEKKRDAVWEKRERNGKERKGWVGAEKRHEVDLLKVERGE